MKILFDYTKVRMFIIYKSNELNVLFVKICQIIKKKPLSDPFEKELLIHENQSLLTYLNIFIANRQGISANFQFFQTHDFFWKILDNFTSKKTINIYHTSFITWQIMNIIEKKNSFDYIQQINTPLKKFQFSFLMAKLFKKYLFYRPEWINMWNKGDNPIYFQEHEDWQRKLWIELVESIKKINPSQINYGNILNTIITLSNYVPFPKKKFPTRLFLISSFALHPLYINILEEIGKYINIYLLHVTPCKKNIFSSHREKHHQMVIRENKKTYDFHYSLMALWGQYEHFYVLCTDSKRIKTINCFEKKIPITLLDLVKNDILKCKKIKCIHEKNIIYHPSRSVSFNDESISINICHHEQHEIEILYKKILFILKKNPDISPGDIIITSTNIDKYTTFINTIFKSEDNQNLIPFFISRTISKNTEIILSAFNKIFNLPISRCNNQEIMELLDIPEIAHKFQISDEEREILYYWIEKVNIRWGLNEKHQNNLLSVSNQKNTWLYGIKKLLLSYAINKKNKIWNNILSCLSINGSRSELIGKIAHFICTLEKWRKKLSIPKTFKSWSPICNILINDFFYRSTEINPSLLIMQKQWTVVIENGLLSHYKKKISFNIIKLNFMSVTNTINNKKFLPGVINFCDLSSVYYIPFKVICIIGANRNIFPRPKKTLNFNLLDCYSCASDPNIHFKDSYLFLQNLSCAQKYFYISCIEYTINSHIKKYPSVFIDQLSDYISNNFCLIGDEKKHIKYNKQKILHHIYKYHLYQYMYDINKKNQTYYYINKKTSVQNNIYKINLKNLISFWKHPIRYYYTIAMKKKIILQKKEIKKTETFFINKLDLFKINNIILNTIIYDKDIIKLYQYYKFSGKLPYGYFGKTFWNKQIDEMKNIANMIMKFRTETKSKKFTFKLENYYIYGLLSEIQKTGLLRWKPNKINYNDRMSLWLEHLVYCAIGGVEESKIIGLQNSTYSFSSLKSDLARSLLFHYVTGYLEGIKKPLWLLQSGAVWIDQVYDKYKKNITLNRTQKTKGYYKLLEYWHGNNYYQGEKNDIYIQNIILELKNTDVKKICSTAGKWLLPILQYKK